MIKNWQKHRATFPLVFPTRFEENFSAGKILALSTYSTNGASCFSFRVIVPGSKEPFDKQFSEQHGSRDRAKDGKPIEFQTFNTFAARSRGKIPNEPEKLTRSVKRYFHSLPAPSRIRARQDIKKKNERLGGRQWREEGRGGGGYKRDGEKKVVRAPDVQQYFSGRCEATTFHQI